MDNSLEELALWEPDIGLLGGQWSPVPQLNEDGTPQLIEGESFWSDDGFPLKEDLNECLGPGLDLIGDESPFAEWLDDRVDISEIDKYIRETENEKLIRETEIDVGMYSLEESVNLWLEMESPILSITETSSPPNGNPKSAQDDGSCVKEPTLEDQVDDSPLSAQPSPSSSLEPTSLTCVEDTNDDDDDMPSVSSPGQSNELPGQQVILMEPFDEEIIVEIPLDPRETLSPSTSTDSQPESLSNSGSRKAPRKVPIKSSRRAKPYSRQKPPPQDSDESSSSSDEQDGYVMRGGRKERKRDQNRTAAWRYRVKKRAEQEVLNVEEAELLEINKELSQKASQLSTEIGYLKGLMREMLISKGLLRK